MNFGPLEFAEYLQRKSGARRESAEVAAARAAATALHPEPGAPPEEANGLSVVSGARTLSRVSRAAQIEAVSVFEAIAMRPPSAPGESGPVTVTVRATLRPVVLVLSSHQAVQWQLELLPGAQLAAVLLSGYGDSTVAGAGSALVSSIGGFYAFKRGSAEFKHLEQEVLRCTGRTIERFQSTYAGRVFDIGA